LKSFRQQEINEKRQAVPLHLTTCRLCPEICWPPVQVF